MEHHERRADNWQGLRSKRAFGHHCPSCDYFLSGFAGLFPSRMNPAFAGSVQPSPASSEISQRRVFNCRQLGDKGYTPLVRQLDTCDNLYKQPLDDGVRGYFSTLNFCQSIFLPSDYSPEPFIFVVICLPTNHL